VFILNRPLIGIPIGDAAGIGPEISLVALKNPKIFKLCRPVLIGNINVLEKINKNLKLGLSFNLIDNPENGKYEEGIIDLINLDNIDIESLEYGKVQAQAGRAAYEYIKRTIELALEKKIKAVATTPINKEAIHAANIDFIGHTEMFGALTGTNDPLTMFQVHHMRIFFLTRHVSMRTACDLIKKERILKYIYKCADALKMLGIEGGSIAVAGFNPHSGEHGLFGDDEVVEIEPAVMEARLRGVNVTGPVSADSVFAQALKGKYSAVLSLYHDQGHIAAKTVDFEKTTSMTIGMPFIRTSVDHGTAYDIAGRGIASSVSMEEAIRLAAKYSLKYRQIKW
jgi:4-hydroxythreonine-4-phosphate dehydrogenase